MSISQSFIAFTRRLIGCQSVNDFLLLDQSIASEPWPEGLKDYAQEEIARATAPLVYETLFAMSRDMSLPKGSPFAGMYSKFLSESAEMANPTGPQDDEGDDDHELDPADPMFTEENPDLPTISPDGSLSEEMSAKAVLFNRDSVLALVIGSVFADYPEFAVQSYTSTPEEIDALIQTEIGYSIIDDLLPTDTFALSTIAEIPGFKALISNIESAHERTRYAGKSDLFGDFCHYIYTATDLDKLQEILQTLRKLDTMGKIAPDEVLSLLSLFDQKLYVSTYVDSQTDYAENSKEARSIGMNLPDYIEFRNGDTVGALPDVLHGIAAALKDHRDTIEKALRHGLTQNGFAEIRDSLLSSTADNIESSIAVTSLITP